MSDTLLTVNAVETGTPKAIVILFGWLGSRPRHVQKYAQLWEEKNCSTIFGVPDVPAVMLTQKEKLKGFALEAAREAIKLLKAQPDESIPVIIHCFSGAGAVVLEQLEVCLDIAKKAGDKATDSQKDLILLSQAIERGGEFFDSSPCYLHLSKGLKAVELGVSNFCIRLVIQILMLLVAWFFIAVATIQNKEKRAEEHWNLMLNSGIASRQAYIYSTADEVVDYAKLEELIAHRKKRPDAKVMVKKLTDGRHCSYLVKHAVEYKELLNKFLSSISEQQKEEEILQQDPDMSDYQMEMD